ncbi:MAG: CDP-alcohol phosphatidyltransferase family protein [Campylobacterota bacterium]|nr:CDP-alcohol phosphatidyltransferase family protein [Campylobacterota bacterium]
MTFLFDKNNHFNLANMVTFFNITAGILAIYFITHGEFFGAALFAWMGGAFDIIDGKIARKYNLSTEFGVQLDSFADFLSFVIVPSMFIFFAIFDGKLEFFNGFIITFVFVYYIISGLRRLIHFNIHTDAGSVTKHFVGVPTPLGAILLWIIYLGWIYEIVPNENIVLGLVMVVGYLLNSKVKIPHP